MKFALVGHPVAGSLSPVLFEAAYGGEYKYFLEDCPSFADAWKLLDTYEGFNVTAPYKQDAFRACRELSSNARRSGAVNLVLRDGFRGYNTDVDGVVWSLKGVPAGTALVVGTGGAARAAITGAQELGFEVSVWGRSAAKVAELERQFGLSRSASAPSLVIYTLPGSAPVPGEIAGLCRDAVVLEANYRDPRLCEVECRRYIFGHKWLLGQAAAGYELFTGKAPDIAAMERILQ